MAWVHDAGHGVGHEPGSARGGGRDVAAHEVHVEAGAGVGQAIGEGIGPPLHVAPPRQRQGAHHPRGGRSHRGNVGYRHGHGLVADIGGSEAVIEVHSLHEGVYRDDLTRIEQRRVVPRIDPQPGGSVRARRQEAIDDALLG